MLGDAPVRSVGGLGQVMHAESRYVVFIIHSLRFISALEFEASFSCFDSMKRRKDGERRADG